MGAISKPVFSRTALPLSLLLAFLAGGGQALAQRNIGAAIAIERDVSGALGGRNRSINRGDGVFSNERIRTANESAAQLQFLDETKLRMGPSAAVVLDRFVYNPDRTAREAAVEVTTGAARWVGGRSRPGAYQVRTPHATIGVRGTIFDVLVEARRTIVTLREGVIVVCPIRAPQRCVTLDTPGQVVIVTTTTIEGPSRAGPPETRFADLCLRPIDRAACMVTTTAQLGPTPYWDGFYAGVHVGGTRSRASVDVGGSGSVLDSIGLGNVPSNLEMRREGALGGVQAGYSWQFGAGVFGLEADLSAMNARASEEIVRSPFAVIVTTSAEQNLNFLGTFRGRMGIPVGDFVAFATGGLAIGHIELRGSIIPVPAANPTYEGSRSLLQAGFAVGGGIDYAAFERVTIRAEFIHYDLGKQRLVMDEITGLAPGEFATMQFRSTGDIVRAAFNVRF